MSSIVDLEDSATLPQSPVSASRRAEASSARRKLLKANGGILSDAELLSLVLPKGGSQATELAAAVLERNDGLAGLLKVGEHQLKIPGLGRAGRAAVLAAVELSRRLARARLPVRKLLDQPAVVASYLFMRYGQHDQEIMGAFYLDVRNRLIAESEIYRGTLNRTAVEPRAILKEAINRSANSFILFHTHPSGDPSPSDEDLRFTMQMRDSGELLGIALADHLILGCGHRWVSLRRHYGW